MESPLAGDGFVLVKKNSYEEDPTWCTDDEYEFVESPVERHAAPPVAHAQPVGGGGGGNQAFPPLCRETIRGCGQGYHTRTIVQTTPPQGAVAPTRSSSPTQRSHAKVLSPFSFYDAAAAMDEAPLGSPYDLVDSRGVADLKAAPAVQVNGAVAATPHFVHLQHTVQRARTMRSLMSDEDDDDDEDDYGLYEPCYDFADFGRSRRVKRSSGRSGRTKKATTRGRPRGEERSSHIAGNL